MEFLFDTHTPTFILLFHTQRHILTITHVRACAHTHTVIHPVYSLFLNLTFQTLLHTVLSPSVLLFLFVPYGTNNWFSVLGLDSLFFQMATYFIMYISLNCNTCLNAASSCTVLSLKTLVVPRHVFTLYAFFGYSFSQYVCMVYTSSSKGTAPGEWAMQRILQRDLKLGHLIACIVSLHVTNICFVFCLL